MPGGGALPHTHSREDETFQVLEGEYEVTVVGMTLHAKPGTTLFAPRGGTRTSGRARRLNISQKDSRD